jgi:hypothetical protein
MVGYGIGVHLVEKKKDIRNAKVVGLNLTRYETTVSRIGCNMCDSPRITWSDKEDKNHLCKICLDKNKQDVWDL